jgi:hypothetical protein
MGIGYSPTKERKEARARTPRRIRPERIGPIENDEGMRAAAAACMARPMVEM